MWNQIQNKVKYTHVDKPVDDDMFAKILDANPQMHEFNHKWELEG